MTALPNGWQVHEGREPEKELRSLKRRLQTITRRYERAMQLRRLQHRAMGWGLAILAGVSLYAGLVFLSPWSPAVTFKHLAAAPNCTMARTVGLAPAYRGEPGYWSKNDADDDGIACEPWR